MPSQPIGIYIAQRCLKNGIGGCYLERIDNRMNRTMARNNQTMMNKNQTSKPRTVFSRRTGLDRRWIHSTDHQPERRRSVDRRTIRRRSFLEPLEFDTTAEKMELFPEINLASSEPDAENPALPIEERGFAESPESISKKET